MEDYNELYEKWLEIKKAMELIGNSNRSINYMIFKKEVNDRVKEYSSLKNHKSCQ